MSLQEIETQWDLIVIGGGVTGASVLREAVRGGLRALLVEREDFASGTSSRSSKLVHGGLRYLSQGKFGLTLASVRQRCRLLAEGPGLVEPIEFYVPLYRGKSPGRISMKIGLTIYDLMAGRREHRFLSREVLAGTIPGLNRDGLVGGYRFLDAQVDDARLVLRLIQEAEAAGGLALNYVAARNLVRDAEGRVTGLWVEDLQEGTSRAMESPVVVNATGWCAETFHPSPDPRRHMRPLRGSHLVIPHARFPLDRAVSFTHPVDGRGIFALPWEGAVLVGTTDLDHDGGPEEEPSASKQEVAYLLEGLHAAFPEAGISESDCAATFAGVRPVLSTGKKAPSAESREHVVWADKGLVTVTGGKLTTFRLLAVDALKAASPFLAVPFRPRLEEPALTPLPEEGPTDDRGLGPAAWRRLRGRYGAGAEELVRRADPADLEPLPGTLTLFAELPYAAEHEKIVHLGDLLLRRVRLGILLPGGGESYLDRIQEACAPALPWDETRWREERASYLAAWKRAYAVPA